jgi:hypothetical protein
LNPKIGATTTGVDRDKDVRIEEVRVGFEDGMIEDR